jgi:hypothetical protein
MLSAQNRAETRQGLGVYWAYFAVAIHLSEQLPKPLAACQPK